MARVSGEDLELSRHFAEHGFVVMPSALPRSTVVSAVKAFDALENAVGDLQPEVIRRWFVMEPGTDPPRIFIAGDPLKFRPELAAIVTDSVIIEAAKALLGTEVLRYHFTNFTAKAPGSERAISWHRDYPNEYMCPRESSFLRVMICLDGMDGANGPTQFLAGSHVISDEEAVAVEPQRGDPDPAHGPVVAATCPPGSLVFIHPKVRHGSGPNRSAGPRRNIITQWGRDDDPVCVSDGEETLTGLRVSGDAGLLRELCRRRSAVRHHALG